ncbi:MAG: TIGR03084 family metal-binding protein [Alphaproteobacteria bacterium]
MMQQAIDFKEESDALRTLLEPLPDADFRQPTQFKGWTIDDVVGHLHMWNWAADTSLKDADGFQAFYADVARELEAGGTLRSFETRWLQGLSGRALFDTWAAYYPDMAARFAEADPKARVKWAGPDMSVRSSITARLMETWAHGQEVYDSLGVERADSDRIRNIAHLGMNTFGWTFMVRGLEIPADIPYVRLTAPSGDVWEWNAPQAENKVEGSATEFCQVVTQVRNIADTQLQVTGETATRWMAMAQCFAGPPETPPAPGTRFRRM